MEMAILDDSLEKPDTQSVWLLSGWILNPHCILFPMYSGDMNSQIVWYSNPAVLKVSYITSSCLIVRLLTTASLMQVAL